MLRSLVRFQLAPQPRVTVDNPDLWRIAARIVGKRRGWRVRTGANARCVWMTNLREPGPSRGDGSLTHRLEVLIDWQIGRGPEVAAEETSESGLLQVQVHQALKSAPEDLVPCREEMSVLVECERRRCVDPLDVLLRAGLHRRRSKGLPLCDACREDEAA
jgi:hypothetical protein